MGNTAPSQTTPLGIIRSSSRALTVTSRNFEELRKELSETYEQRADLLKKLSGAKSKYLLLTVAHLGSYPLIFGFFNKRIPELRSQQKEEVASIEKRLTETFVNIKFADASQLEKSWLNCLDTFEELAHSEKMWDLTYAETVDKVRARSIADQSVKRTRLTYTKKRIEIIKSDVDPIYVPNANGPNVFIYPTFVILFKDRQKFGIFDLKEVRCALSFTRYHEEEKVPKDAEIVDYTWKKTNKNGSMDKRYKNNYRIPVAQYGSLILETSNGLQESYMFSNGKAFEAFAEAFNFHLNHTLSNY